MLLITKLIRNWQIVSFYHVVTVNVSEIPEGWNVGEVTPFGL